MADKESQKSPDKVTVSDFELIVGIVLATILVGVTIGAVIVKLTW